MALNDLVKKDTILHFKQQGNAVKPLCVEFNSSGIEICLKVSVRMSMNTCWACES